MKISVLSILVLSLSLLLFLGCSEERMRDFFGHSEERVVDYLQDRNGVRYEVNADKPFTGKYVTYYDDGQKKSEANYKDGKAYGLITTWHNNGQKDTELTLTFKDGKEHALVTAWRENGQKKLEIIFKNGEVVEKLCCD